MVVALDSQRGVIGENGAHSHEYRVALGSKPIDAREVLGPADLHLFALP
jgi:hypothetical protein